jgi:hypothetical protein
MLKQTFWTTTQSSYAEIDVIPAVLKLTFFTTLYSSNAETDVCHVETDDFDHNIFQL